jgi:hypothetical protein
MRFEIVIDELVLTGFGPCDRLGVADALEHQLAEHVRAGALEGGIDPLLGHSVRAADVAVPAADPSRFSERLGAGVAGSLVGALGGRGR